MSLGIIAEQISDMTTTDQLRSVQNLIASRWAYLEALEQTKFCIGDRVQFISHTTGNLITGTVIKLLKKNIRVITSEYGTWTVSPTLLKLVEES